MNGHGIDGAINPMYNWNATEKNSKKIRGNDFEATISKKRLKSYFWDN